MPLRIHHRPGFMPLRLHYRYIHHARAEALAVKGLPRSSSSPTAYGVLVPMSRPLVPDLWPTPSAFGGPSPLHASG
ncbi:hypothetical protein BDV93DRAFT_530085, partial [Ceratobasidium sp. AG-I]